MSGVHKKYGYLTFHEGECKINLSILQKEGVEDENIFIEEVSLGKKKIILHELINSLNVGEEIVTESLGDLGVSFFNVSFIILEILSKGASIKFIEENLHISGQISAKNQYLVEIIKLFHDFETSQKKYLQTLGIKKAKKEGRYTGRKPKLNKNDLLSLKKMILSNKQRTLMCKELNISRPTLYRYIRIIKKEEEHE